MSDATTSLRDHYCFGCGSRNPFGLHLEFRREGDEVVARYQPRPQDQGFPGRMHGGILSVMLDEAMGWALYVDRVFAVTAKMETRFRGLVGVEQPLEVRARIEQRTGRRWQIVGRVLDERGKVLAEATGLFLRMPPEQEAQALAELALDVPEALRS